MNPIARILALVSVLALSGSCSPHFIYESAPSKGPSPLRRFLIAENYGLLYDHLPSANSVFDEGKLIGYHLKPWKRKTVPVDSADCDCKSQFAIRDQQPYLDYLWINTWLLPGGLALDQEEITNLEWQLFLVSVAHDSAATTERYQPATAALPSPDYYTNPQYSLHPVVGISYAQAQSFCHWRGRVVTAKMRNVLPARERPHPEQVVVQYRLPTEAEWEQATQFPNKASYRIQATAEAEVNPHAADYLRRRSGTSKTAEQVEADIIAWNNTKPVISTIVCRRELPYFLVNNVPQYEYSVATTANGMRHLLGNVAEMIQEQGVTKGGSYRDAFEDCQVSKRGVYSGPAPTIGFRCIAEILAPISSR